MRPPKLTSPEMSNRWYKLVRYKKLGATNLRVSQVALGTMSFGTRTTEKESHRILDAALDMGINLIDTSNDYGYPHWGLSEEIIGNWLNNSPSKRDRIILATKVYQAKPKPHLPNEEAGLSAYKIKKQIDESLRRLKTEHIDLYQVHHVDRKITGEEMWDTFGRLSDQGKILYLGSSNYSGWGLAKHQMEAKQSGRLGFVSEQSMYNLICRYPELELIPCAQAFNIGILAYMPLAGGILAGGDRSKQDSRASNVMNWYGLKEKDINASLAEYQRLCDSLEIPLNAMAIAWTLSNPAVSSVVLGVRAIKQFRGIEKALSVAFTEDTLNLIDTIFPISKGKKLRHLPAPEAYAW